MAINIQYPGSIAAMGQVALQGGEYAGQQQAIQNQLAFSNLGLRQQQLQQQGQQFNADMNFRRNAMLFNDYQQQRNFAQQAQVNRASQIRGIQGNLLSQQIANQNRNQYQARQFAFGATQDAVQFEQRKELLDIQNKASNESRDLEFKRRQEAARFEDEITRERFEYQYSFQQQKEREKYENAMHEAMNNDAFSPEEKNFVVNQLTAKYNGVQPTPRALQEEFAEGKGPGNRFWEDDFYMTVDQNGQSRVLAERKPEVKTFINPVDGSLQSTVGGDVMTLTESPFDKKAKLEEMKLVLGDLGSREILVGTGANAIPRPMTTEEKMSEYSKWESAWDKRKQDYIDARKSEWQLQEDAKVLSNQQRIDTAKYQSSPGRSEMITSQSNQPSQSGGMYQQPQQGFHLFPSHMRFDPQNPMQGPEQPKWNNFLRMPEKQQKGIINAVNHLNKVGNGKITRKEADSLNIASAITSEEYEMIPDGVPWFNPYNGRTAIKGTLEDKGFNEFDSEYARKKILQKASKFAELNNPFARVSTE